jgi:HTH-type transcriptional regulator/antitoxin HigA
MLCFEINKISEIWPIMSRIVFVPHTENEYNKLVALLDDLIDEVGEDEDHPLASLMDIVGTLIEKYENEYVPELQIEETII